MNFDLVVPTELDNNKNIFYLYYISNMNMWVAYGRSAYILRMYVHENGWDSICGFSTDVNLPFTIIDADILTKLRHLLDIHHEKVNFCIEFRGTNEIQQESYMTWAQQQENLSYKIDKMGVWTPVSQYVPKEGFIADNMLPITRSLKRFFDFISAFCCLVIFSPAFLLCFLLIKKEDGGPAIFKQERIGRFGKPFIMYKFRSMAIDAEKMGPQLSHSCGNDDPRLTKIGRFIRAHHLDELPQFWNVLMGDMSFVGPRPERKFFINQILQYDQRYAFLYQIRPGVTSFATLYNGYTDTMEKMLKRLEYDLYYLSHRSLWFDGKVLIYTFMKIIFGKKF